MSRPKLIKRSRSCKGRPRYSVPQNELWRALANPRASGIDWLEFHRDVILSPQLAEKSVSASVHLSPETDGLILYALIRYDSGHAPNFTPHLNLDLYILSGVGDVYDSWKVPESSTPGHYLELKF